MFKNIIVVVKVFKNTIDGFWKFLVLYLNNG